MKIVFPELKNPVIAEAVRLCPEIEAVDADDLTIGCQMLAKGQADAMIVGIDYMTRDVILACRENIPMVGNYFSSCFVMKKGDKKLILADGGVCKKPNANMLTTIVEQTYDTAKRILEDEPRIAMLSFSTLGSGGEDESIAKIHETLGYIREKHPEIIIDGEMQLDVAIDEKVAAKKAANSPVGGRANVLICPDLNAGNILYKAMERFGGWTAAGPILQGFAMPISDLSRGSTVEDVVLVIKTMEELSHE